ncbi:MAG: phosphoinositide 3-kinase [Barrevirus sp.]|uniref:Phosphoinositide 3-kinase n=1 Tax=Barrevirus sp. TaxID=2487763 RepID=A0A3G4ZR24_9VIRU|nr:MAG: phosphoinositide 3-kinase [Barrevirus sp.]
MDNLAYSVFLENKENEIKDEPLRYTLPKRVLNWVNDTSVSACYNCDSPFTLFFRRHHCRFCGKVFCGPCVKYNATIPDDLLSADSKEGTWNEYFSTFLSQGVAKSHKVCKDCYNIIGFIDSVKHIIELLIALNLDLKELKLFGTLSTSYHYASNYVFSIFRDIQDKLPDAEYTDLEKKLLKNNASYLVGHNSYLVHLIRSLNRRDPDYDQIVKLLYSKKKVTCFCLMCHRQCQITLNSFDAIDLLSLSFKDLGNNDILRSAAIDFIRCSDNEFKCYLPLLISYLSYDNGLLSDFIVKRCTVSFNLLNSLYWELQLYTKDKTHSSAYISLLNKLKELFKDKAYSPSFVKILEGYSFVKIVENIGTEITENGKTYMEIKDCFKLKGLLTNPLNNKNKIQEILIDKIKIKNSATKPMIIPCKTVENTIINVLYKREDVRKDQVIMNVIKISDLIIKKELGLDLDILTYDILPTDKNAGLIEIVGDCDTLYFIKEKLNSSITNYILEHNDDKTVKSVRDSFINSMAFYSVICYLCGVGDRHLDNIMVSTSGRLFQIDYSFLLGADPVTNDPGIRVTIDMIEAIGGLSSKNYQTFIELSTKIYNCLRRHIGIFMHLLNMLPKISDIKLSKEDINKFLIKRFIPGTSVFDASNHLIVQLERHDYLYSVKDFFHYHSQEKTVSSAMSRLTYAVSKLVQYAAPTPEEPMRNTLRMTKKL